MIKFLNCPQSESTYKTITYSKDYCTTVQQQVKLLECLVRESSEFTVIYNACIARIVQREMTEAQAVVAQLCYDVADQHDSIAESQTGEVFFYRSIERVAKNVYNSILSRTKKTVEI